MIVLVISWGHGVYVRNPTQDQKASPLKRIPAIIHQTWKTADLSTYTLQASNKAWKEKYPTYTVKLWTDADIEILIRTHYPWLWQLYRSYPYNIQRADVARYVILHHEGGIYADLDAHPGELDLEELRSFQAVFPATGDEVTVSNHFFMVEPKSLLLEYALHNLEKHNIRLLLTYVQVFWSTGPLFMSANLKYFLREWEYTPNNRLELAVIDCDTMDPYVYHETGRSWMTLDGIVVSYLGDNPHVIPLVVLFVVAAVVLVPYLLYYRSSYAFSDKRY